MSTEPASWSEPQPDDEDWRAYGACKGGGAELLAVFFSPSDSKKEPGRFQRIARAKAICDGCPVKDPCLQYALDNGEHHGVWGGKTERDRKRIKKARGLS